MEKFHHSSSHLKIFFAVLIVSAMLAVAADAKPPDPPATPVPGPSQGTILSDITTTLQQQIQELSGQSELQRRGLAKAREESQPLAVAVSTHKTALSLDKISVEQAKELQQYYGQLIEQKAKRVAALSQDLEKFNKIQVELVEATQKTEIEKSGKPPAQTAAQKAAEKQRQQYLSLANTAITKLEEIQKAIQAHLDLLTQEQQTLTEFNKNLETFIEEKSRQLLLERQKPTDIFTMARELCSAALALPQQLIRRGQDFIQSGTAASLLQTYRKQILGLLIFLVLLLYTMRLLKRASREFRQRLAAKAQTFSLKLVMALINALVHNYYLLAILIWLIMTLSITQVLTRPSARIILGGLLVVTGISLLKHLLWALLAPGEPEQGILRLPDTTAHFYYRFGLAALSFLVIGSYLLWCLRLMGMEGSGYNFAVLLYMLVMIFWVAWLLRKPHLDSLILGESLSETRPVSGLLRTVRFLVLLGLTIIIIVDLLGFQNLALYLAGAAFLSGLVLAGGWLLKQLGNDLNTYLTAPNGFLAGTMHWEPKTLQGVQLFLSHTLTIGVNLLTAAGILLSWVLDLRGLQKILAILSQGPSLGPVTLSPLAIFLAAASIWLARKLSRFSQVIIESGVARRQQWDIGIQHTIGNTIHYALMTLGFLMALGFLGINLSNLAIIAGGLGVGIGFGLQNIVNNFISGLILLFERPIKIGDLLVIDGQWGTVKAIRVRSTVFETAERAVLIIPNSDLLSNKILNWTFYGRGPNRLALKVAVSYSSDVQAVTRILDQVCRQNHRVLTEPPPQVFFSAYGDSSLDFTVWVFLRSPADRVPATHELHAAIFDTFAAHGIEFPYPQLDVHVRSLAPQPARPVPAPPVMVPPDPEEH